MPIRTHELKTDESGNIWKILFRDGVECGRELANPGAEEATRAALTARKALFEGPVSDLLSKDPRDFTQVDIARALKYLLRLVISKR